ncbi:hypothetical protein D9611_005293 [Ephemerocybe angulata]|uniref:Uncharacterized protein n=2 Tax=Ephemerocybe angulata TaxID=980116 RepID=A0A8H6M3K4_9AGAR|nr:hypothetical protein D9611_005293 [Tulosesus angulatus]KAF6753305.1 hypothetical protein DFP72DRAFT_1046754 [Tulosesus angulatus]
MERCLQIPEIVAAISCYSTKKSAFSMALTCRTFLEPSLDNIWRNIYSFAPLLACLPHDLWKVEVRPIPGSKSSTLALYHLNDDHILTPSDLRRYRDRYAYRIKVFFPRVAGRGQYKFLTAKSLQALWLATDSEIGALSPRLEYFVWPSPTDLTGLGLDPGYVEEISPFMSLFLAASISWMVFELFGTSPLHMASLECAFRRLSKIKKLICASPQSVRVPDALISGYSWDYLEDLTLCDTSPSAMRHILSLPRLTSLDLRACNLSFTSVIPENALTSGEGDSILQRLHINVADVETVIQILELLPSNNQLRTFKATVLKSTTGSVAQHAINTLGTKLNTATLKKLTLLDDEEGTYGDAAANADEPLDLELCDPADITPLYGFSKLEKISICLREGIRTTPKELARIPCVWPNIYHLNLLPTFPTSQTPTLDHMDLLDLARACPSLEDLGLRFDATQISNVPIPTGTPIPIRFLRVDGSPISSATRTAAFLRAHFPALVDVNAVYPCGFQANLWDRRWAHVGGNYPLI